MLFDVSEDSCVCNKLRLKLPQGLSASLIFFIPPQTETNTTMKY